MSDDKCVHCLRRIVATMEEFWKNPSYSCPKDVLHTDCNDSNWLELYCAEGHVAVLESRIRDLEVELSQEKAEVARLLRARTDLDAEESAAFRQLLDAPPKAVPGLLEAIRGKTKNSSEGRK